MLQSDKKLVPVKSQGYPITSEQLRAIADFTEELNRINTDFPDGLYLSIKLMHSPDYGGVEFGEWSDELDSADWTFSTKAE